MALNLASPGIVVREVDLTIGRVDATSGSIGAIVAPFTKGPVEEAQLIESEEDLLQTFGQPYSVDKHYEYWMVASSYLAYGGTMQVIRANDAGLKNAFVGAGTTPVIKSDTHYNQLGYDDNAITGVTIAAKTPGSYANGITGIGRTALFLNWDMLFSYRLTKGYALSLDIFNVLNSRFLTQESLREGPDYRKPLSIMGERMLKVKLTIEHD